MDSPARQSGPVPALGLVMVVEPGDEGGVSGSVQFYGRAGAVTILGASSI